MSLNDHTSAESKAASVIATGTPGVWAMGAALTLSVVMIVALTSIILTQGLSAFWPKPIELVSLNDGGEFLGQPVREESYSPTRTERRASSARGEELPAGELTRRLYRVGNRDLGQQPFRWVGTHTIQSNEPASDAVFVERAAWGVWIGRLGAIERSGEVLEDEEAWEAIDEELGAAEARIAAMEEIRRGEMGEVSRSLEQVRLKRTALTQPVSTVQNGLAMPVWIGVFVGTIGACIGVWRLRSSRRGLPSRVLSIVAVALGLLTWVEHPFSAGPDVNTEARLAELDERERELSESFGQLQSRLSELEQENEAFSIVLENQAGVIAPRSRSNPNEPMLTSQVVRIFRPSELGFTGRMGVYLSRWHEFVTGVPREANTEGGVMPVIVGTTLLTALLTVVVVPLGVMAALYMREYAKQGIVISILRIAINNLAGVPSIVYGVFGLGFFCYTLGRYIDQGPVESASKGDWWTGAILTAIVALSGVALGVITNAEDPTKAGRWRVFKRLSWVVWALAGAGVLWLVSSTPYFGGFFAVKSFDGTPTFGGRGLLWASLTLALLTLPVVIVATEEAIASVPQSLREGSFGCGASQWQTIRRVVLPGAMPGVMTGAILAMARGAGEVAPLMVVGAVKLAPDLPFEARFPFVFADRSFMHLGFHIYDLGFQSPDSEAARGLVWATTLLLLLLVLLLNATAIIVRTKLRKRLVGGQF